MCDHSGVPTMLLNEANASCTEKSTEVERDRVWPAAPSPTAIHGSGRRSDHKQRPPRQLKLSLSNLTSEQFHTLQGLVAAADQYQDRGAKALSTAESTKSTRRSKASQSNPSWRGKLVFVGQPRTGRLTRGFPNSDQASGSIIATSVCLREILGLSDESVLPCITYNTGISTIPAALTHCLAKLNLSFNVTTCVAARCNACESTFFDSQATNHIVSILPYSTTRKSKSAPDTVQAAINCATLPYPAKCPNQQMETGSCEGTINILTSVTVDDGPVCVAIAPNSWLPDGSLADAQRWISPENRPVYLGDKPYRVGAMVLLDEGHFVAAVPRGNIWFVVDDDHEPARIRNLGHMNDKTVFIFLLPLKAAPSPPDVSTDTAPQAAAKQQNHPTLHLTDDALLARKGSPNHCREPHPDPLDPERCRNVDRHILIHGKPPHLTEGIQKFIAQHDKDTPQGAQVRNQLNALTLADSRNWLRLRCSTRQHFELWTGGTVQQPTEQPSSIAGTAILRYPEEEEVCTPHHYAEITTIGAALKRFAFFSTLHPSSTVLLLTDSSSSLMALLSNGPLRCSTAMEKDIWSSLIFLANRGWYVALCFVYSHVGTERKETAKENEVEVDKTRR